MQQGTAEEEDTKKNAEKFSAQISLSLVLCGKDRRQPLLQTISSSLQPGKLSKY
jgi:hypothetical protein